MKFEIKRILSMKVIDDFSGKTIINWEREEDNTDCDNKLYVKDNKKLKE